MKVDLTATGGYTGLARAASFDTRDLDDAGRDRIEAALRRLCAEAPHESTAPPTVPRYTLTIADGGASKTVTLAEPDVPADLRPLLARLH